MKIVLQCAIITAQQVSQERLVGRASINLHDHTNAYFLIVKDQRPLGGASETTN